MQSKKMEPHPKNKSELFVEKSIEINAPVSKVWEMLTDSILIKKWLDNWWPDFGAIESDWKLGSTMYWKAINGTIAGKGKILAIDPHTLLRFSFKSSAPSPINETFILKERDGHTTLTVSIGDFGKDSTLKSYYYPRAMGAWDKFLAKIKELGEN